MLRTFTKEHCQHEDFRLFTILDDYVRVIFVLDVNTRDKYRTYFHDSCIFTPTTVLWRFHENRNYGLLHSKLKKPTFAPRLALETFAWERGLKRDSFYFLFSFTVKN